MITTQSVQAAESASVVTRRSDASLVTSVDQTSAGMPFYAALRLRLAPGWHTYWQNPGDAGVAPQLTLDLSPGTTAGPLLWPVPQRIAEGSLTTYAYTGEVLLPFTVAPGSAPTSIHAHADWLVCKDVCVPEQADFALELPAGSGAPSAESAAIEQAVSSIPKPAPFHTEVSKAGVLSSVGEKASAAIRAAQFFPLEPGTTEKLQPRILDADNTGLRIQLDPVGSAGHPPAGVLVLTAANGTVSSYEIAPGLSVLQSATSVLPALLLAALAGGLLLNLMPCVFPILAMKAIALARLSGADRRRTRAEAVSYSAGVVTTFLALGAGSVALRSAGWQTDWGLQFQSPIFVTAVMWLLLAIGLSLSGVFTLGESLMGRGSTLSRTGGHLGTYLTGMLAVVVASPCTAPFMGTALAGTLLLPAPAALSVFAALGFGLASPYLILAAFPRLVSGLPRPGPWMQTLQQLLAFPMYAAAVWLLWVVSQQTGSSGVLAAGGGCVLVGLAGWALGAAQHTGGKGRLAARTCMVTVAGLLVGLLAVSHPGSARSDTIEPFTTARLDELRRDKQMVFVNMTASWCLSCLVNEEITLSRPAVQAAFKQSHTVYLKGDWTSQNPAISAFLREMGQDGVPLYVFFAPGRPPKILPQVLSEDLILRTLSDAPT